MQVTLTYDTDNLGCVMLDTTPHPVSDGMIPDTVWLEKEDEPHITLLYGLLTPAYEQVDAITRILEENDWTPPVNIIMDGFAVFQGPEKDAVVATTLPNPYQKHSFEHAHRLISALPHVNTFPVYKPHLTLGYTAPGVGNLVVRELARVFPTHTTVKPLGLNFGRDQRKDKSA